MSKHAAGSHGGRRGRRRHRRAVRPAAEKFPRDLLQQLSLRAALERRRRGAAAGRNAPVHL